VCLLTDGRPSIADVKSSLEVVGFDIARELPSQELWSFGGPALLLAYRPEVNGSVTVDVVNHAWPDAMGDPKADPMTFGAWSLGHFGPFAYPAGLERAMQHAWAWPDGRVVAPGHRGFIRIRSSYVGGAARDAPVFPNDYDAVAEMMFLTRFAIAAANTRGVLCHFNPNGEVLRDAESVRSIWAACASEEKLPLLLWMNVRFFNLSDDLGLMDTVGNRQLDVNDVEAVFPSERYDPGTIDYYLRNVTHYLLDLGREIQTGEAIDGPGDNTLSWTAEACDQALVAPPRPVLRLYPKANRSQVARAITAIQRSSE
jgi:hypothetical protein